MKFSKYLYAVSLSLQGIPSDFALHCIREAVIEFCTESQVWREEYGYIDIVANQTDYKLTNIPDGMELDKPSKVTVGGAEYNAGTQYSFVKPDILRLVYAPSADAERSMLVECIYRPDRTSDEWSDRLGNDWYKAIVNGAKYNAMTEKGKPWSDPSLAQYHKTEFASYIAKASDEESKGNVNTVRRVNLGKFVTG